MEINDNILNLSDEEVEANYMDILESGTPTLIAKCPSGYYYSSTFGRCCNSCCYSRCEG